ncbi:MAG: non-heme iron oxygenase ferredoxin subunit [Gammaproteobacteria bacterium]|nr:non-heme iron oxygenase ferredoxin subunit [Gammaproteobacteria bacterium]
MTSEWIDLGTVADLEARGGLTGEVDGRPVTVTRIDGRLYAFEDCCTHDGESLAGGEIEGTEVVCPRHGARFCLDTGEALTPPAYEPIRVFGVREDGGRVLVAAP